LAIGIGTIVDDDDLVVGIVEVHQAFDRLLQTSRSATNRGDHYRDEGQCVVLEDFEGE
jgi:hypothetical protein